MHSNLYSEPWFSRWSTSGQGVFAEANLIHSCTTKLVCSYIVNCSVPMPFSELLQPTSQSVTLLLGSVLVETWSSSNNMLWFPTKDAQFKVILTGDPAVFRGQRGEQPGAVVLPARCWGRGVHRRPCGSVKFEMNAARLREVAGTCEQYLWWVTLWHRRRSGRVEVQLRWCCEGRVIPPWEALIWSCWRRAGRGV
jgi:hypothetical protein